MQPGTRVLLLVPHDRSYGLAIHAGIRAYASAGRPWLFQLARRDDMWRPHGVIAMLHTQEQERQMSDLADAVVNVSAWSRTSSVPRVIPDNYRVGQLAAEYLLGCGLRHLGMLTWADDDAFYNTERLRGFEQTAATHGIRAHVCRLPRTSVAQQENTLVRWLRALPRPVGVFATFDVLALTVTELCRLVGLRVPDDVAILGSENDEVFCEVASPPLSSVDMAGWRVGYEAAATLDRMLRGQPVPAEDRLVPPSRVAVRRSTGPTAIRDADVRQAVAYIADHAGEPMRIADVMAGVQVSYDTLLRRFRQERGRTIQEEITAAQINRARALLIATDLPVARIAAQVGFSTHSHFSHAFRQCVGVTPSAFRAQFCQPE